MVAVSYRGCVVASESLEPTVKETRVAPVKAPPLPSRHENIQYKRSVFANNFPHKHGVLSFVPVADEVVESIGALPKGKQ